MDNKLIETTEEEDDEHTIDVLCPLDERITPEVIGDLLPAWKTHIISCDVTGDLPIVKIVMLIAAKTPEEFQDWLNLFEEKTKCSYSIKATEACTGRYVTFKRRLHCIHSTSCSRVYDPSTKNRTRNTNCPSSLYVKILAVKKRYQGKNKDKAPNPDLPCRIVLVATHNHTTDSAEVLRFRPVSEEVREKLLELYAQGHTPATALESIRMDICLNYDDYSVILNDRKYCPDYMYCYHLYKKELKKQCNPLELGSEGKNFIMKRLESFNVEVADENGASMLIEGSDYVICICPPMFKRIHRTIKTASEIVFIDSTKTVDFEDSRLFTLLTPSECGELPLGILLTSSQKYNVIVKGFQLLKDMVGNEIFGGNLDGPQVFLTDDCENVRLALQNTFAASTCIKGTFSVLRAMWKWLLDPKNKMPEACQCMFFQQFRGIVYSKTTGECTKRYSEALDSAKDYPSYVKFLESYWKQKEMWAPAFHDNVLEIENKINAFSETAMRLFKDKIFRKVRTFNLAQMVDFILLKLINYYARRLLDAAGNRSRKSLLDKPVEHPPEGLLDRIQILNESIALVPSDSAQNLFFIVNIDALMCICSEGSLGILCKHVEWMYFLLTSSGYSKCSYSIAARQQFHFVATGIKTSIDSLESNNDGITNDINTDNISNEHTYAEDIYTVDVETDDIISTSDVFVDEKLNLNTSAFHMGTENIKIISDILMAALEESPHEVSSGLELLKNELLSLDTPTAIASACSSFSKRFHQNTTLTSAVSKPPKRRKVNSSAKKQYRHRPQGLIKMEAS